MSAASKILVIQTGFIGDVILSTPVFEELKKRYPKSEITLLTTPAAFPLFEKHESLSQVLAFDKRGAQKGIRGFLSIAFELRKMGFEKVFSLHKSYRTSLLTRVLGVGQTYGFREAKLSFLYSHTSTRKEYEHDVERNLALLKPLGLDPRKSKTPMKLNFSSSVISEAGKLVEAQGENFITIAPGSVWATKRWTVEGFAQVASHFITNGVKVVLIGGPDDVKLGERIVELSKRPGEILDLTGKCKLSVSAAVISKSRLLVSNDSAPLHIASATSTPVIALFCATVPEFGYGPWQVPARVLGVEGLSCRPCGRHGGNSCPTGTHACQIDLSHQMVIDAANALLDETSTKVMDRC